MKHKHYFTMDIKPQMKYSGGSRKSLTVDELDSLDKISLAILKLEKGCSREPHWHPNAGEMAYCLKGKSLVTIFATGNLRDTFTVEPGELFFVPKGYMHHIANIGEETAEFILAYNHRKPQDLDLSESLFAMTDHVLSKTFKTEPSFFYALRKKPTRVFITPPADADKPSFDSSTSRYKINLEAVNPQINTDGGSAKIANSNNLRTTEDLSLYSLRVYVKGIREPHWHPNANELNYTIQGKARVTILSPGGNIDTIEIGPEEGTYIPASYLHSIENIGSDELRMAVFFSNGMPGDIGLSGAISSYSSKELAAVFGVASDYFKNFPRFQTNEMIVAGH